MIRAARNLFFTSGALLVVVAACEPSASNRPPSQTTTTSGVLATLPEASGAPAQPEAVPREQPLALDDPAVKLGQAICARKLGCDQIGAGRSFDTVSQCNTEASRLAKQRLEALDCENGLSAGKVADCVTAARGLPCATQLDVVGKFEECSRANLCVVTGMRMTRRPR